MSSKSKARRKQREQLAEIEAALNIQCPSCKAGKPGVWCGPVLEHAVFNPIHPWMHTRRYEATK